MKTLFVLRHAKSSWDEPNLSDFERPLNKRGRKAAPRIGAEMVRKGYRPDIIISSPAVRARQTTDLVRESAGLESEVVFNDGIYGAAGNSLIYLIAEISDTNNSALIVGHNPGFERVVELITGESKRMPTAALAVIELDLDSWSEYTAGTGRLLDFLIPKELE